MENRLPRATLFCGDALGVLKTLPTESVRCCVTSPPYWGLRDYGVEGQLGLETHPDAYVERLVTVFREVRRVLTGDGTLWLNLGDGYAAGGRGGGGAFMAERREATWQKRSTLNGWRPPPTGLKAKDLVGIPWRVAFALQADEWWLRSDIIWAKPNPMPESVTDRPTRGHEYVFLLSKSARYYYDAAPLRTPLKATSVSRLAQDVESQAGSINGPMKAVARADKQSGHGRQHAGFNARWNAMSKDEQQAAGANARTVWTIPTQAYSGAHFATFPEELARRCLLAGSAVGDTVLDPFGGSGTVARVATANGRDSIYVDLNPAYVCLAEQRIGREQVTRAVS